MLENIVDPILYLQVVKTQSDHFKVQTGTFQTYDQYCKLLISAETTHDRKNQTGH